MPAVDGSLAHRWAGVRADLLAALPAWVLARVIVAITWLLARAIEGRRSNPPEWMTRHVAQGILGWDAERYVQIAASGYEALPEKELRFFPLVPLLTRAADPFLPGGDGFALLVLANLAALGLGALLHRLVLVELGDHAMARRAAWLVALTPASFVLVWGYSEPIWMALAAGALLAARRNRWWLAAGLGVLVGLSRPVAPLLAVGLAVEALRGLRGLALGPWVARAAAVASPVAGAVAYLAWVGATFGDPRLPYSIQSRANFRGSFVDPITALSRPASQLISGEIGTNAFRLVWAAVFVALVVVAFRRWPAGYGAFAAATVLVALCSSHLGSFERYGFSAFPIVLALATVCARPWVERAVLAVGAVTMTLYGTLAMLGPYVP